MEVRKHLLENIKKKPKQTTKTTALSHRCQANKCTILCVVTTMPAKKIRVQTKTNRSKISTQQSTRQERQAHHAAASAMGRQDQRTLTKQNQQHPSYFSTSSLLHLFCSNRSRFLPFFGALHHQLLVRGHKLELGCVFPNTLQSFPNRSHDGEKIPVLLRSSNSVNTNVGLRVCVLNTSRFIYKHSKNSV